jgi:type II secretory pathway component PulM
MRFSLYKLMLVLTLLTVPFAWLHDHVALSERNRQLAAEIVNLQKEQRQLKTFADAARAETKTLQQMIQDYKAAQGTWMRQLKQAEQVQSVHP